MVLADGLGMADAAAAARAGRAELESAPVPLRRPAGTAPAHDLTEDGFAVALRQLGLTVDRRSCVLRPGWRSDDAALAELQRRPAGVADVTLLQLSDAGAAAARFGVRSNGHRAAVDRLWQHVASARDACRHRGQSPHTCVIGTGPMRTVTSWFDPAALLPRRLRSPWSRASISVAAQLMTVDGVDWETVRLLRARLGSGDGLRHGRLLERDEVLALDPRAPVGRICYAAAPAAAFVAARAALPLLPRDPDDLGFAVMPWKAQRPCVIEVADTAAAILLHCAQLTAQRPAPAPVEPAALPDVESLLAHHALDMVEH